MKKLLIVDDELCLTEVLSHALEKAGHKVVVAHNGEEGFALACSELPDLIVSDFQMPVIDGVQMAVRLRQNSATGQIPIILLTARGHRLDNTVLETTRIKSIVSKPFSARQLKAKVDELLGEGTGSKAA